MKDRSRLRTSKSGDVDEIYNQILSAIFERKLQPGTRLKEEELCEVFGVGRGGVRKVLQRLAHENLVRIVPNSGAFISEPTISESKEVFQVRRLIEAELVKELAAGFNADKYQALQAHLAKEKEAHDSGDDNRRIRLSGEFHLLIGTLAEKPVMTDFLREIISRTSLIIALYERSRSIRARVTPCQDHYKLAELLNSGAAEEAVRLMLEHLHAIEASLDLDPPPKAVADLKSIFAS